MSGRQRMKDSQTLRREGHGKCKRLGDDNVLLCLTSWGKGDLDTILRGDESKKSVRLRCLSERIDNMQHTWCYGAPRQSRRWFR